MFRQTYSANGLWKKRGLLSAGGLFAAALVVGPCVRPSQAVIVSSAYSNWTNGGGDNNWSNPANWSTSSGNYYPNNTFTTVYEVTIGGYGPGPVNLDVNATIDTLTFGSSGYTLNITGNNSLSLTGISTSSTIGNGAIINFTGDGGALSTNAGGASYGLNFDPTATINVNYPNAVVGATLGGVSGVNINSQAQINVGSATVSGAMLTINPSGFANTGTITVDNNSTLNLAGAWNNSGGYIAATNNSTLNLGGSFNTNAVGNISADGASTINITGVLDTSMAGGGSIALGNYGSTWQLNGGTIQNGDVNISGVTFNVLSGTLNNEEISGADLVLNQNNSSLTVLNGLTADSGNVDITGANVAITFDGTSQSTDLNINATSTNIEAASIYLGGPTTPDDGFTLTLNSDATLQGHMDIYVDNGKPGTLINNGEINANISEEALIVGPTNLTNNGTLAANNGGILWITPLNWNTGSGSIYVDPSSVMNLGNDFDFADLGALTAYGTVNIMGILNNASTSAVSNVSGGGAWYLDGGEILGGSLAVDGSNTNKFTFVNGVSFTQSNGVFDGVHVTGGDLDVSGTSLYIQNGITVDTGNIVLSNGATLYFNGPAQNVDSVTISTTGYNYSIYIGDANNPSSLTLGAHATVNGSIDIQDSQNDFVSVPGSTLINNGTIEASSNGWPMSIEVDNFTNNGTVKGTGGANVTIDSANWSNSTTGSLIAIGSSNNTAPTALNLAGNWTNDGSISVTDEAGLGLGGTFTLASIGTFNGFSLSSANTTGHVTVDASSATAITGSLNLRGTDTLTLNADTGSWYLGTDLGEGPAALEYVSGEGTIENGTVAQTAGQTLDVLDGILNNVNITGGDLTMTQYYSSLTLENGLTISTHNLNVNQGSQTVVLNGTQLYDNLNFNYNVPSGNSSSLDYGGVGTNAQTITFGAHFVLQGQNILVSGGSAGDLINNGLINSNGTGSIDIEGGGSFFTNNATVEAQSGASLSIGVDGNDWTNAGTGLIEADGGTIALSGNGNYSSYWLNTGTIEAINGGTLKLGGDETTADLGTITSDSTSHVFIDGSVINTGATLTLNNSTGSWTLDDQGTGAFENGIIDLTQGQTLHILTGAVSNVEIQGGDLTVDQANASLALFNTLTVDTGNVDVTGNNAQILFATNFTANNLDFKGEPNTASDTPIINLGSNYGSFLGGTSLPTLTIAANSTIQGTFLIQDFANITYYLNPPGATLINNGVIDADTSGEKLTVQLPNFTNNGTMEAVNGGVLQVGYQSAGASPHIGNITNTGAVYLHNGILDIPYQTLNIGDGKLQGSGAINGSVALSSDPSILAFQIGGATQGSGYDSLTINGNMALAGDLAISFTNSFQSSITSGETFQVLSVGGGDTLSGAFANVVNGGRVETGDEYGSFLVNYGTGVYSKEILLSDFLASAAITRPASLYWNDDWGNGLWDINTSFNWNDATNSINPSTYADTDSVTFDNTHNASGIFNITLNTIVNPGSVTVNNSSGNYVISGTGSIAGSTGLSKEGNGSLTLDTVNTYTGTTLITTGGQLILGAGGSIADSATIEFMGLAAAANFNVSAVSNYTLGGSAPQQLEGVGGVVTGNVTVGSQGILSPGVPSSDLVNSMSISGSVTFVSGSAFDVQVTPTNGDNDKLIAGGSITLGGAENITSTGTLTNGESFTVLQGNLLGNVNVYSSFSAVNLPALSTGLSWTQPLNVNNNLSGAGNTYQQNYTYSVNNTGPKYTSNLAANDTYAGFNAVDNVGTRGTQVIFLGGTVSTATSLSVQFSAAPADAAHLISDYVAVNGTNSDTYVLELSYTSAQLGPFQPISPVLAVDSGGVLKSAVLLNNGGSAHEILGAYTSADFSLGDYGVDPTDDVVWAVLNYSAGDKFGVSSRLVGDAAGTGTVTPQDISVVLSNQGDATNLWSLGDFNNTNSVTPQDISQVLAGQGNTAIGTSIGGIGLITSSPSDDKVPEPGSLALLAVGVLGMALRGRSLRKNGCSSGSPA